MDPINPKLSNRKFLGYLCEIMYLLMNLEEKSKKKECALFGIIAIQSRRVHTDLNSLLYGIYNAKRNAITNF